MVLLAIFPSRSCSVLFEWFILLGTPGNKCPTLLFLIFGLLLWFLGQIHDSGFLQRQRKVP